MEGIKELIYKSKIIKINRHVYFCICDQWTVKIRLLDINNQEYWLHYNGVYIDTFHTNHENFKIITYRGLKEYLENESKEASS